MTQTQVSYFIGDDPSRWKTGLATYDSVALGEVWRGVDVRLRAYGRNMEKLFVVHPGAKPSRIRMQVGGARSLRVNGAGALVATTGLGDLTFTPPVAYQEDGGARREVDVAYEVRRGAYGFRLGPYDPALPVVIDPLIQATYLGGSDDNRAYALAIHPTSGEVYVAGQTHSTDFPGAMGGAQPASAGAPDAFVARLDATLTTLIQTTYLGGRGTEIATSLAIHPLSGEVYVGGGTDSTDFPGTAGGAQPASAGASDVFVARLNGTLTALIQATYLGGSGEDGGRSRLAFDPTSGDVYVTVTTRSTDFAGTAGGAQPASGGDSDAFVARLNGTLTTLVKATYVGGSSGDFARDLAIHPTSGDVYVAGITDSTDFPGTAGGAQPVLAGRRDVFVTRLDGSLTTLVTATYLGGSSHEDSCSLAIDPASGDVYVAGTTYSDHFPGAPQANPGAVNGAAFVARLSATLTTLRNATYLGGNFQVNATSVAIHPTSGAVYVAGSTLSGDFFGTTGGAQSTSGGGVDAFVARLNGTLTKIVKATYLGSKGWEFAQALAIHPTSGDIYVAGQTNSTDFPGTSAGAQPTKGDMAEEGDDGFVARLTPDLSNVLNPLLIFGPIRSTFVSGSPTAACAAGTFSFEARLTNTSNRSLSHLAVKVATLTHGALLENADGGPGGVGALLTIPPTGAYADGVLDPGESVDVSFVICLKSRRSFSFFVDVRGDTE